MRFIVLAILSLTAAASAQVKDFTVPAVAPPFTLSEARGSFVALHFLLKTECPYCLKHTQTYVTRAAEVPGVVNVFFKPDEPAEILKWLDGVKPGEVAGPIIYHDAGGKLAERFGIPGGYQFHGQITHYPALIVIDRAGNEAFRYVGKSNADRYPFEQFAAKIAELNAKADPAKPASK